MSKRHEGELGSIMGDEYVGLLDNGSDEDESKLGGSGAHSPGSHKKIGSWTGPWVIMCANLMGAGVLALPAVMKYVGWIPGLGLIFLLALGAIYSGTLISRLWTIAHHRKIVAEKYGDLGRCAYGEQGERVVNFVTYFYISIVTVVFHLTSAESLQTVFYDVGGDRCLWEYSFFVVLMVLPLGQIRSLANVSYLAIIGAVTIVGTVLIAVVRLVSNGPLEGAETVLVNTTDHNARAKVNTLVLIVFSYCGQAIFAELISSMQTPADFPKAVWSSTITMCSSYILIASVGYYILGQFAIAPVTDALPEDPWAQVANVLLFAHVLIAYIIELNILTKGLVHFWDRPVLKIPQTASTNATAGAGPGTGPAGKREGGKGAKNRLLWLLSSSFLVLAAFLLSNLCSFFSELLAFAGATGGIATTYIFPCVFILKVDQNISRTERAVCKTIVVLSCVFSSVCLVNTCLDIVQKWQDVGPPFMCMSCNYKKANHLTPGVC